MTIENIEVNDGDELSPNVSVIAYTGGEEAGGINCGNGVKVFKGKDGATFNFRTLQAGSGVSIAENENELLFSFDASDLDTSQLEFGSTDNLAEGTTNLYYRTDRVRGEFSIAADSNPALVYRESTGEISLVGDIYTKADFDADFATKDTSDLSEAPTASLDNAQMYFTRTRARQSLSGTGDVEYNSATGEIRVNTYKTSNFNTDFQAKTTDDLTQGAVNEYYSDVKVQGVLNAGGYQTQAAADLRYLQQTAWNAAAASTITAQNITDWNALVSGNTIVEWDEITSKPAWVVGSAATTGQVLAWGGTEWTPTSLTIPTDVSELTDNSNIISNVDPDWADIQNKPSAFTPISHGHNIVDIVNLQSTLDNKASITHSHTYQIDDIVGLTNTLDTKADEGHIHQIADVAGLQTALDNVDVDETITSLTIAANILTYTDEDGNDTDIDLSVYIDDTNLARITGGTFNNATSLITFTRDDNSTFDINVAALSQIKTLENLTDTTIGGSQADGSVLTWNTGTGTWVPAQPSYFSGEWADIDNKPITFTATAHVHPISEITNLQTELDAKAASSHTHTLTEISDGSDTLDTLLNQKSDASHTHVASDITDLETAVQNMTIDGGTY